MAPHYFWNGMEIMEDPLHGSGGSFSGSCNSLFLPAAHVDDLELKCSIGC